MVELRPILSETKIKPKESNFLQYMICGDILTGERTVLDTGTLHLTVKTGIVLDCMAMSAVDEFLFFIVLYFRL